MRASVPWLLILIMSIALIAAAAAIAFDLMHDAKGAASITEDQYAQLLWRKVNGGAHPLFDEPPERIRDARSFVWFMWLLKKIKGDERLALRAGLAQSPDGVVSESLVYYADAEQPDATHIAYTYIADAQGILVLVERRLIVGHEPYVLSIYTKGKDVIYLTRGNVEVRRISIK